MPYRRLAAVAGLTTLATALVTPLADAKTAPEAPDVHAVHAVLETPPLFDDDAGGSANADDPAIWYDRRNARKSLVIGTAKEGGLRVYGLDGRQVQSLPAPAAPAPDAAPGRFNNVDLLPGLRLPGGAADVAVVSDRGRDRIRVYRIDPGNHSAPLTDVTAGDVPRVFSPDEATVDQQYTAYGVAAWRDSSTGRSYALTSRRHGTEVALLELSVTKAGTVTYHKVRTLTLPSSFRMPNGTQWSPCEDPGTGPQVEGMVVDTERGILYAAQEDIGIWRVDAHLTGPARLVDTVREYGVPATYDPAADECVPGTDPGFGGKHVNADVEGLTIYYDHGHGYLLASSQGDNTFVVYKRGGNNTYLGNFAVTPGANADGSEECDGAAVLNAPLGPRYPHGLLVVQDGFNKPDVTGDDGTVRTNTDFKFVDWDDVAEAARLG